MKIYRAKSRENDYNVFYPILCDVQNKDDLREAVLYDHIPSHMVDNHRSNGRFLQCDCGMIDCDNSHSEDPEAWLTEDAITETFPVKLYLVRSRSYMKEKRKINKKTGEVTIFAPRGKWHGYMPLKNQIEDAAAYERLMLNVLGLFPYIDCAAIDPAHMFYGVQEAHVTDYDEELYLDEWLESIPPDELREMQLEAITDFANGIKSGTIKNEKGTRNTVKKVCAFLGIDNLLEGDPEDKESQKPQAAPSDGGMPDWIRTAEQERSLSWLEEWAETYDVELGKRYTIDTEPHKGAIAICVTCAWEEEHSMNGSENETVIIVELSGQLDYLCRHSHGDALHWKDFRAKIEGRPVLEKNKHGKALPVIQNYVAILRHDKKLEGHVRYNALSGRAEIRGAPWDMETHAIRDDDIFNLRLYVSQTYGIGNKDDLRQAVSIVSRENCFHPVKEVLSGLQWDGKKRVSELFPRYLGAERNEYTSAVTMLLLHGAIQRVFNPGVKFDYCVILADTRQGTGKSSMCRFLAMDDNWFSDELADLGDTKASYEAIRGRWIMELGEMIATRRTKDVEAIKAYITRKVDTYREPYGMYPEQYPRQCIFIGTSNKPQFLPEDRTGNRRFIPLLCDGSRAERHPMEDEQETREYILQCYAEAMEEGSANGWKLILDRKFDEQLEQLREDSTAEDAVAGKIQNWLDEHREHDIVCSWMLFDLVLHWDDATRPRPKPYELQEIADVMNLKIEGWRKYRGRDGKGTSGKYRFKEAPHKYGSQRAWERIPPESPGAKVGTFEEWLEAKKTGDKSVSADTKSVSSDTGVDTNFDADNTEIPF